MSNRGAGFRRELSSFTSWLRNVFLFSFISQHVPLYKNASRINLTDFRLIEYHPFLGDIISGVVYCQTHTTRWQQVVVLALFQNSFLLILDRLSYTSTVCGTRIKIPHSPTL